MGFCYAGANEWLSNYDHIAERGREERRKLDGKVGKSEGVEDGNVFVGKYPDEIKTQFLPA